ncbi:MAG: AAA family ATPase [Actinobacteria bacterium]|nr:AAA family ATPase [Actinomycetota bacterium]
MYLKHLYVEGFKSFPEYSGLEMAPGVCVIVGPNGSGKSNLTDAVAWVLGEDDLSSLRLRDTADLVFAGTDELLPMSVGVVSAVLDPRPIRTRAPDGLSMDACKHGHPAKHSRELPEGMLTITRRLHADGAKAFVLNGVEVTRAEVRAALAEAGVASPPVAVIRQGELERFLVIDASTRRRLIEEAAGVPDLGARRDRVVEETAALRLRHEHLLGEREEVTEHVAQLEQAVRTLEQARSLEERVAHLRAGAVLLALETRDRTGPSAPDAVSLLEALDLPTPTDASAHRDWTSVRTELDELVESLRAVRPTNTGAPEELKQAIARVRKLDGQIRAAEEALRSLATEAAALAGRMASTFAEVHARIESRFRDYYELLAPGGEASLPFERHGDGAAGAGSGGGSGGGHGAEGGAGSGVDSAGVEVMVRPPGKVLDRVSSLSGGERSLAALSLALAVFQEHAAPLFVLDEVEPALDDTNIRRLQKVLDSVAETRQLLVVSHQQRAKEAGDAVFGIERNLDGASQVKFRFEPATRRLDVFRRTWASDDLRRSSGDHSLSNAPGRATEALLPSRAASPGGSSNHGGLTELRGPRSRVTGLRRRPDGPWEGVWESLGNPNSTRPPEESEGDGEDSAAAGKTCC